jgi:hypothetical protein
MRERMRDSTPSCLAAVAWVDWLGGRAVTRMRAGMVAAQQGTGDALARA